MRQYKEEIAQLYRAEFEELINTLHIDYFYNHNYPANYGEEFGKWYGRVEDFVKRLAKETREMGE